jgi:hypothetical protein
MGDGDGPATGGDAAGETEVAADAAGEEEETGEEGAIGCSPRCSRPVDEGRGRLAAAVGWWADATEVGSAEAGPAEAGSAEAGPADGPTSPVAPGEADGHPPTGPDEGTGEASDDRPGEVDLDGSGTIDDGRMAAEERPAALAELEGARVGSGVGDGHPSAAEPIGQDQVRTTSDPWSGSASPVAGSSRRLPCQTTARRPVGSTTGRQSPADPGRTVVAPVCGSMATVTGVSSPSALASSDAAGATIAGEGDVGPAERLAAGSAASSVAGDVSPSAGTRLAPGAWLALGTPSPVALPSPRPSPVPPIRLARIVSPSQPAKTVR